MTTSQGHDQKNTLYCSFCGKNQQEVRKLIAGPTVFICNLCVEASVSVLRREGLPAHDLAPLRHHRTALIAEDVSPLERAWEIYDQVCAAHGDRTPPGVTRDAPFVQDLVRMIAVALVQIVRRPSPVAEGDDP